MERGYVKFWRKSIDSGLLQNPNLFTFWAWCLFKASHKKRKQMVGMELVELNPGEFVFGRKMASVELKMSEQTIRTCLKKLKKLENLTTKATNKFTVITIVNWDAYQDDEKKTTSTSTSSQPASNQQVTSSQPAANHKQECKHVNIETLKKEELPKGNLSEEKSSNQKTPFCPHKTIISLYNETLGQVLPECKSTNKTIEGNLRARWREDKTRQDLEWWKDFFNGVSESDFLMGRSGDWQADFTWLVKPTNMSKVINGNYRNKQKQEKATWTLTG